MSTDKIPRVRKDRFPRRFKDFDDWAMGKTIYRDDHEISGGYLAYRGIRVAGGAEQFRFLARFEVPGRNGKRCRVSKTIYAESPAAAEKQMRELSARYRDGRAELVRRRRFDAICDHIVAPYLLRLDLSPTTFRGYRRYLSLLRQDLGHQTLDELTTDFIEQYFERLMTSGRNGGDPLKRKSVKEVKTVLAHAFEACRRADLIDGNPARRAHVKKDGHCSSTTETEAERARLRVMHAEGIRASSPDGVLNHGDGRRSWDAAVFERFWGEVYDALDLQPRVLMGLGLLRGLRPGEMCALICESIIGRSVLLTHTMRPAVRHTIVVGDDGQERVIRDESATEHWIRSLGLKTQPHRTIMVPTRIRPDVNELLADRRSRGEQYLFLRSPGKPYDPDRTFHEEVKRICAAHDLPELSGYGLRHTAATLQLFRGAAREDVAEVLGTSPEMLRKHYRDVIREDEGRIAAAQEEMDKRLF